MYQATATLSRMASEGLQIDDVIQILSILADEANLRVTVKESLKGGLITGLTTVLGGLIGGRIGLAVGKLLTLLYHQLYWCCPYAVSAKLKLYRNSLVNHKIS